MNPFFKRYGSKWRISGKLPPPPSNLPIIEPFAGAAGYSTRYGENKSVILTDTDQSIANLWRWLIKVPENVVAEIPSNAWHIDHVTDVNAKELVRRWFNFQGSPVTAMAPTCRKARDTTHPGAFWGARIKNRIREQIHKIRNWNAFNHDYRTLPNEKAIWIVDPPYQNNVGGQYTHTNRLLNYQELAEWCKTRNGLVIVHEQSGANWLPFKYLGESAVGMVTNGTRPKRTEVVWSNIE